jgi:hypothetical protein
MTVPSGTGKPACFNRAQLKAFAPHRSLSPEAIRSSGMIVGTLVFTVCILAVIRIVFDVIPLRYGLGG